MISVEGKYKNFFFFFQISVLVNIKIFRFFIKRTKISVLREYKKILDLFLKWGRISVLREYKIFILSYKVKQNFCIERI